MGHCQFLSPLCPIQVKKAVVGSQQRLPCGSLGTVTTGKEPVVDGCPASPHSIKNPHPNRQGPSTYEAMLSGHPEQYAVLKRCGLLRSKLSNRTVHPMTIPFLSNLLRSLSTLWWPPRQRFLKILVEVSKHRIISYSS